MSDNQDLASQPGIGDGSILTNSQGHPVFDIQN